MITNGVNLLSTIVKMSLTARTAPPPHRSLPLPAPVLMVCKLGRQGLRMTWLIDDDVAVNAAGRLKVLRALGLHVGVRHKSSSELEHSTCYCVSLHANH